MIGKNETRANVLIKNTFVFAQRAIDSRQRPPIIIGLLNNETEISSTIPFYTTFHTTSQIGRYTYNGKISGLEWSMLKKENQKNWVEWEFTIQLEFS